MNPWRTRVDDAEIDPVGWDPLPSGVEITARPLVDVSTTEPLWARLTYRDALHAAELHGARLPTREEVVEAITAADHVLLPVTLSYGPEMVTLEHAREHDRRVGVQVKGSRPRPRRLAGIGKHWVAGAAPGRSRICGWPIGERLIQAGTTDIHDDQHHDYATTTMLVRDLAPLSPPLSPGGHPLPARRLGLRALDVAREHLAMSVREVPGPDNNPQIGAYLYPARRGGTPVAGILDATGTLLRLTADSYAWCAGFASFCLALSIDGTDDADRAACPHGYRISVAELVADARARSTWRERDYRPQLGDLAIWKRAGGDPRRGGTGHVARVSAMMGPDFTTIDGNSADQIRETQHRLGEPDLVGWIRYPP